MKTASRLKYRPDIKNKKRGFVLLSVLMVMVVLLSTVTALAVFARSEVRAADEATFQLKARNAALVVLSSVKKYMAEKKTAYDAPSEALYNPALVKHLRIADVAAVFTIRPLDDKIPLASLFLPDGVTIKKEYEYAFKEMFNIIGKPELREKALDFMDTDTKTRTAGGEEDWYLNKPLEDLSQFLDMPGMGREQIYTQGTRAGLDKFLTPFSGAKMNLNTIDPLVFMLLDDGINAAHAKALAEYRKERPIEQVQDLKKISGFPEQAIPKIENVLGVTAEYIEVEININQGLRTRRFVVVIKKSGNNIVRWSE